MKTSSFQVRLNQLVVFVEYKPIEDQKPLPAEETRILDNLSEDAFKALLLFVQKQDSKGQQVVLRSKTFTAALKFARDFGVAAGVVWGADNTEPVLSRPQGKEDGVRVTTYWRMMQARAKRALNNLSQPPVISPNDPRHRRGTVARRARYSRDGTHHSGSGHA